MTDPISDYLTRLRNAMKANHRIVEIPASNIKKEMTKNNSPNVPIKIIQLIIGAEELIK